MNSLFLFLPPLFFPSLFCVLWLFKCSTSHLLLLDDQEILARSSFSDVTAFFSFGCPFCRNKCISRPGADEQLLRSSILFFVRRACVCCFHLDSHDSFFFAQVDCAAYFLGTRASANTRLSVSISFYWIGVDTDITAPKSIESKQYMTLIYSIDFSSVFYGFIVQRESCCPDINSYSDTHQEKNKIKGRRGRHQCESKSNTKLWYSSLYMYMICCRVIIFFEGRRERRGETGDIFNRCCSTDFFLFSQIEPRYRGGRREAL